MRMKRSEDEDYAGQVMTIAMVLRLLLVWAWIWTMTWSMAMRNACVSTMPSSMWLEIGMEDDEDNCDYDYK